MPDLPTLQESGYQGVSLESWFAVFAPLGTPPAVIAQLNAACDKALGDKATRDALFKAATEPVGGDAERLAKLARADSEKYARIVREVNIKTG
jgi:tripartite-type tricarboxylate transporter receptor subunit TctC